MSATSTSNISKNTILCHACAEDVLDEYIPCQGFCNAVFHPNCSGVKPALLKEIASHRQIFWVCKSCTNLMVDLRHRRSIQCAYEAGQELSLSHHNRIVEQLKSELLTVLKAELSANFAKLVASNSLTPRSSSLNKGGFRGSGSRRLFDNNPAPPLGPNPIPPKPVTGKPGGPADVPERIVAKGFGAPAGDDSPRFWLYLSRVSRNVTEEQITKLAIDRLGVSEIKAKRLVAKGKDVSRMRFISFKVGMNFDLKDKALESSTWPDGLLVREFEERSGEIFWEPTNAVNFQQNPTPPVPPQDPRNTPTPKSTPVSMPLESKEMMTNPKDTEPTSPGSQGCSPMDLWTK